MRSTPRGLRLVVVSLAGATSANRACECAYPAGRLDRFCRARHHHRPRRKAHGALAAWSGAVHRHGRDRRCGRSRGAASHTHQASLERCDVGRPGGRAGQWTEFEAELLVSSSAGRAGDRGVQPERPRPSLARASLLARRRGDTVVETVATARGGRARATRSTDSLRSGRLHQRTGPTLRSGARGELAVLVFPSISRRPRVG